MYLRRLPNASLHPKVRISLQQKSKKVALDALIDSGSACSTIHPRIIARYKIQTTRLELPRSINNADGTPNKHGKITDEVNLFLDCGINYGRHTLAVVDTAYDDVILGIDWLSKYNPIIDWQEQVIKKRTAPRISRPFSIKRIY